MIKKIFSAALLFVCLLSGTVLAHHAPGLTGVGLAGPILTNSASTLEMRGLAITIQSSYLALDTFSGSKLLGEAEEEQHVHSFDYHYTVKNVDTEFQPGSGSRAPIIGLAVTKRLGRVCIEAKVRYTVVTEGSQDTDLGDLFTYDRAVSYHIPDRSD